MDRSELQRGMYEVQGASIGQRLTLALFAAIWLALVWWLLFGGGIQTAGDWFGFAWRPGGPARRAMLAGALSIYYVRILFTEFVFLKRGVSWSEVFTIVPWILCIDVLLAIAGGVNRVPAGAATAIGGALFAIGSWMNTYAEHQRNTWKQQPANRDRLYTQGLFRLSRHPNYFGDVLSFSGLCLISGAWITALIPVLMLAGFVFVNVPALDSHLGAKYGAAFEEYARRTPKLIPFIY